MCVATSGMLDMPPLGVVWISRIIITNYLCIIYSIDQSQLIKAVF